MSDEANKVSVKPVRSFLGEEGDIVAGGPAFSVSRQRAADLRANGLVEDVDVGEKSAGKPENKKAAEPENKSASSQEDKHGRRGRSE